MSYQLISFMDINPQFTFDNSGNPIGVFLPIEEWKEISTKLEIDIPDWQKDKVLQEKQKVEDNPSLLKDWDAIKSSLTKQ